MFFSEERGNVMSSYDGSSDTVGAFYEYLRLVVELYVACWWKEVDLIFMIEN